MSDRHAPDHANEAGDEEEEEDAAEDGDTPPVGIWRWVEPKSVSNKY